MRPWTDICLREEERREKISLSLLGRPSPLLGKTYEEIYGPQKATLLRDARARDAHKQKGKPKPGVSKALMGRTFPHMTRKRSPSHRRGLSIVEEYGKERARKITTKRKKTLDKRGSYKLHNNPNWRGGLSFKPYLWEFNEDLKLSIKVRDGNECQKCFTRKDLCVHHIDYNKSNNTLINLITLCIKCNSEVNFQRPIWERYFQERVVETCGLGNL